MKYFAFEYKSSFNKFLHCVLKIISHFIVPVFAVFVVYALFSCMGIEITLNYMKYFLLVAFFCGVILNILYLKNIKGVYVTERGVSIHKYSIDTFGKFITKKEIPYSKIVKCEMVKKNRLSSLNDRKYRFYDGNSNTYIRIITNDKTYCFSIQKSQEFISLINELETNKTGDG